MMRKAVSSAKAGSSEKIIQSIGILSLGCPRNIVDSENILGRLNLKGYPVVDLEMADVAIVNTCAFIEDAKKESIDAILELIDLKRKGKLKKIIVYGCLAQRYKDALRKELPEVDAFVGRISLNHSSGIYHITDKHYSYLKICEGCVNNCSYCIIPQIKGKFVSLDIESILKRVKQLNQDKISELNIIGQDITGYGIDLYKKPSLAKLLKKIIKITGNIRWIRLLYLHPKRVSDELIKFIQDEPRICKYIDLPVQHINGRILKLMNRQTTRKEILLLIDKIRSKIPAVALRTSVIVGFPSETEREFAQLLDFIKRYRFERLGAFMYSREEGTKAFDLQEQIPQRIKAERFSAVMSTQQEISREINSQFLGKTFEVLVDEPVSAGRLLKNDRMQCIKPPANLYLGRSQYDAPEVDGGVYVQSRRKLSVGEFVRVKITDTLEYDLVGEAL